MLDRRFEKFLTHDHVSALQTLKWRIHVFDENTPKPQKKVKCNNISNLNFDKEKYFGILLDYHIIRNIVQRF